LIHKLIATAAKQMGVSGLDDLLVMLGSAEITGHDVFSILYPELQRESSGETIKPARAVVGLGAGQTATPAICCQPVPGERIIGITYRGKGVQVHSIDCAALIEFEDQPDRWIDLRWTEGNHAAVHVVTLEITLANGAGALGRICALIGEQNANISDMQFTDKKPDFYKMLVDIQVRDISSKKNLLMYATPINLFRPNPIFVSQKQPACL